MSYDKNKIIEAIVKSLMDEFDFPLAKANDIAFHMTDWLNDLSSWQAFCENPDSLNNNELSKLLMSFLLHVPSHVAAASKLISNMPVEDDFNVGAVSEK